MQTTNEILCSDCMEWLTGCPDKSFDCVFTDVPYKQEFHNRGLTKYRPNYNKIAHYGANLNLSYEDFFEAVLPKLRKVNFFTFCNKETMYDFVTLAKKHKFSWQVLPFCKTSPTPFSNNQWLCDVEFGLHIFHKLKVLGNYHTKRSWSVMSNFKEKGIDHPTPKKVDECVRILTNITEVGDKVLDPFCGSGTTAIACEKLGRNCVSLDNKKEFCDLACVRLLDYRKESGYSDGSQ